MTALTLALIALAAAVIGSAGHRFQLLPFGPAFALLGLGLLLSLITLVLAVVRITLMVVRHQPGPMGATIASLVVAIVILAIPVSVIVSARLSSNGVPNIHDITTDTADPPAFVDVLPLRVDAPNTTEYGGVQIADQQRTAYPDIRPVTLPIPPDQAFDRALDVVRQLGWDIVGSNRAEGRIEATDTTFWFGFKDDVVIRLRPERNSTRVDVRSVSRVGGGDAGTNAKRIRRFVSELQVR